MRANYRMQRLHIEERLYAGQAVEAAPQAAHYLTHVLRLGEGDAVLAFNGRDGEWKVLLRPEGRKRLFLEPVEQTRPQPAPCDLVYCFAPLKQGRLDYMVQKAVEMGAGVLQPVITQHTQVPKLGLDRIRANAVEAAEQCGVLALPECREAVRLDRLLDGWDASRRLIFCDEGHESDDPLTILNALAPGPLGVLIESALDHLFIFTTRQVGDQRLAQRLHEAIEKNIRLRRPAAARNAVHRLLENTDEGIGLAGR